MMSPIYSILLALMCDIIEAVVAAFVTESTVAAAVCSGPDKLMTSPQSLLWFSYEMKTSSKRFDDEIF